MAEEQPRMDPETREQIKALKQDIAVLRADLKQLARSARGDSKARLQDMRMRAWDRARDLEARAEQQLSGAYGTVKDRSQRALTRTREEVEHRPLTSALTALGIGFLLGKLIRFRR